MAEDDSKGGARLPRPFIHTGVRSESIPPISDFEARPVESSRASDEWSATNWDTPRRSELSPAALKIAAAIDSVARRIRSGELKVDDAYSESAESAMAAALAALLRGRD